MFRLSRHCAKGSFLVCMYLVEKFICRIYSQYCTTLFQNGTIRFICKSEFSSSATIINSSRIFKNRSIMYNFPLHLVLLCRTGTKFTRFLNNAAFLRHFLHCPIVSCILFNVCSKSQVCLTILFTSKFNMWFLQDTCGIPSSSATFRLTEQLSAVWHTAQSETSKP